MSDMNNQVALHERLRFLVESTGYTIIQKNGQRIFSHPAEQEVPKGCEVFVGKLPKDCFEDTLVPLFSQFGRIHQLRLMIDFTGKSRGYGFISFFAPQTADTVVKFLNNYEIRPRHHIGVYKSVDNRRLFVGGLPVHVNKEDVLAGLSQYVEGIKKVIMYPSFENKNLNRGFAFVEFVDHRSAAMARRKLTPGSFSIWNVELLIDWADPIPEPDPVIMSKVTKLYIRNLPYNMTNQLLYDFLSQLVDINTITKTHKVTDYAFVHFVNRESAEKALAVLQGKKIGNDAIEVTWARPKQYSKECRMATPPNNFCLSLPPKMRKSVLSRNKGNGIAASNLSSIGSPTHSHDNSVGSYETSVLPIYNPVQMTNFPNPYQNVFMHFHGMSM